jgi:hypothetical protein
MSEEESFSEEEVVKPKKVSRESQFPSRMHNVLALLLLTE